MILKPRAEVHKRQMRDVDYPGHNKVKAEKERHPAMFPQNHLDGFLPCQNDTTKNMQRDWRRKGTGAPPPDRLTQSTPELKPHLLGKPPTPPGRDGEHETSHIIKFPCGCAYSHTYQR